MIVTEKDREDAEKVSSLYLAYDCDELAASYIKAIRIKSADQARKESADRAVEWIEDQGTVFTGEDNYPCFDPDHFADELREAILGDSVVKGNLITDHIPDTGKKLAIAVKALKWALEYIGDGFLPEEGTPDHECGYTTAPDTGYCEFCENYWISRDALKEIQG